MLTLYNIFITVWWYKLMAKMINDALAKYDDY